MFVGIANPLTFIRLGWPKMTYLGSYLTNFLLIYTFNYNFGLTWRLYFYSFRNRVFDRVGKAQSQIKLLALSLRSITNPN